MRLSCSSRTWKNIYEIRRQRGVTRSIGALLFDIEPCRTLLTKILTQSVLPFYKAKYVEIDAISMRFANALRPLMFDGPQTTQN